MSTIIQFADQSVEAWKALHEEAMACRNLEEDASYGLALLKWIRQLDESTSQQITGGEEGDVSSFRQCYKQWLSAAEPRVRKLSQFEATGYSIPVLGQMLEACAQLRALLAIDTDRLNRPFVPGHSVEDIRARLQRKI